MSGPGRPPPRGPNPSNRLRLPLGVVVSAALFLGGCGLLGGSTTTLPPPPTSPYNKFRPVEQRAYATALAHLHGVSIPTKAGAPAPSLPPGAFGPGLGSHVVLGFVPSWELYQASSLDYAAMSEVSYFALQVNAGGKLDRNGQGWADISNGSAGGLVADAHAAGDRALLSLYAASSSTLSQLTSSPAAAAGELANEVAPLLQSEHFDGVDIDFEGQNGSDRAGFVRFMAAFSGRLRSLDPHWSIVLNTFPQAAVDSSGFFDVKGLVPYVSQFFVMAYDMGDTSSPGATAPLLGENLSVASSLASYESIVPGSKLILGIPFYGYDFAATGKRPGAATLGTPVAVTYTSIAAAGRPAVWDPASETPYISFERSGQYHQTWFDDPVSVALKVALASALHTAGVGVWELGMAGPRSEMVASLDGGSPPARLPLNG